MFTYVYPCLLEFTYVYSILSMFNIVYSCLPKFTCLLVVDNLCLRVVITYVYHCLLVFTYFTRVYLFKTVYSILPMFTRA